MNIPNLNNHEEIAINTVVSVLNKAQDKLGHRQNLFQLANSRKLPFGMQVKVNVTSLGPPLAKTSEYLIRDAIEKKWRLTENLMYVLKYMETSQNEASQHFYYETIIESYRELVESEAWYCKYNDKMTRLFEYECLMAAPVDIASDAIFSQPTITYPIPQVTVSVFFRLDNLHTEPPEIRGVPNMIFRIEGHMMEYDMRYVKLELDWILAEMKMKINLFQRIEELRIF